jgi:hypothetical protein
MGLSYLKQLFNLGVGFNDFVKRPLSSVQALNNIKLRMENRERNFLFSAKKLIYENLSSPYRKLLLWSGCDYGDLEESVKHKGLEKTLEKLRDEGVYITLKEFKSIIPICRRGLTIETSEPCFDNPFFMGKAIEVSTSGSRSKGIRVMYDWDFISSEADNEMLLYKTHGLLDAPLVFWLPSLPASSGIHNVLINLKFRRPPVRWFSHLSGNTSLKNSISMKYIYWLCKLYGLSLPQPEFTNLSEAYKVSEWMERIKKEWCISVLRTYASSAIRVVQSAIEKGADISSSIIFTGGEPLTDNRLKFMEGAGVRAFSRYVSTEAGLIGASCPFRDSADDMHVYMDRIAVIQMEQLIGTGGKKVETFLFTSLLPTAGKVMLNTDIGDFGHLFERPCDCLFGELGMNLHISNVRGYDKLTGEGMTLIGSELDEIVGELVMDAGGSPDDYQFWETEDEKGLSGLIITINPEVRGVDEKVFIDTILKRLSEKNQGTNITSQVWREANIFKIVREYPRMTKGRKLLSLIKDAKKV